MSRPELEAKLKEVRSQNIMNGESIGMKVEYADVTEVEYTEKD